MFSTLKLRLSRKVLRNKNRKKSLSAKINTNGSESTFMLK